jgi:hypothetical protein
MSFAEHRNESAQPSLKPQSNRASLGNERMENISKAKDWQNHLRNEKMALLP